MNSFYEHHKDNIHWHYRCFDRILLNGVDGGGKVGHGAPA